jgi:hypothetical protein
MKFRNPERKFRGATIARVIGRVLSIKHAYGPARLVTRNLLASLRELPLREVRIKGQLHRVRNYSKAVGLNPGAVAELRFLTMLREWNGLTWCTTTATRVLYTDGSATMYGGLVREVCDGAEGKIVAATQGEHAASLLSRQSVHTEEHAVLRALIDLEDVVRGETVLHRTDSSATLYGISNGGYNSEPGSGLNLMAL